MELDWARAAAKGFPQPPARVYLFTGSDDALKREAVLALTTPLLDDSMADFDREEMDVPASGGDGDMARRILSSVNSAPFLSQRRVTIVTGVQKLAKEDLDLLSASVSHLGALSLLVLVAGATEYEAGKAKSGTSVPAKLTTAVGKAGVVVLCDAPGDASIKTRVQQMAKERGKTVAPDAVDVLTRRAMDYGAARGGKGGDIHALHMDMEKVLAYIGERDKVTRADALAVGVESAEDNIFALLDAVGHRDAPRAAHWVDELLRAEGKPDGVAARTFVMLARHLRLLWGAKYLSEKRLTGDRLRGGLPPDAAAVLSGEMAGLALRQSYRVRDYQDQARGWDWQALRRAQARVLTSDMALKGMTALKDLGIYAPGGDPASNLRLLVIDLCRSE